MGSRASSPSRSSMAASVDGTSVSSAPSPWISAARSAVVSGAVAAGCGAMAVLLPESTFRQSGRGGDGPTVGVGRADHLDTDGQAADLAAGRGRGGRQSGRAHQDVPADLVEVGTGPAVEVDGAAQPGAEGVDQVGFRIEREGRPRADRAEDDVPLPEELVPDPLVG